MPIRKAQKAAAGTSRKVTRVYNAMLEPWGNADQFSVSRGTGCPAIFSFFNQLKMKEFRNRIFEYRADFGRDGQ